MCKLKSEIWTLFHYIRSICIIYPFGLNDGTTEELQAKECNRQKRAKTERVHSTLRLPIAECRKYLLVIEILLIFFLVILLPLVVVQCLNADGVGFSVVSLFNSFAFFSNSIFFLSHVVLFFAYRILYPKKKKKRVSRIVIVIVTVKVIIPLSSQTNNNNNDVPNENSS